MFNDTMSKVRDMVAELDDDLPCSLTVRKFAEDIQKGLDELQKDYDTVAEQHYKRLIETNKQENRIKELEDVVESYRKMVSNNGACIVRLENEKRELAEELEILQNDNNKLCEHIEELNRNLDSANRENDELRRELNKKANRLHDEIANKDDRIEALVKENDILSKTVGELERERRVIIPCKLIDELQAAREKVEELEKQIKERDEWIENLKEENEALKRKADGWKENAKRSVATIDYMRDKNDKIEKYVDKLNCDIAQKDEQIEKLNKELAIARVGSQTRMSWEYTISRDEALKAINEAIKKLNEEN